MHKGAPGVGKMVHKKWYISVLQRAYRRHKKEKDFRNTICRIKHWKSNKYERFFLLLNDWAGGKEKPYSSVPKPCHGNAFTENAKKKTPFVPTDKKTTDLLKKKLGEGHRPSQSHKPRNPKQVCIS